VNKSSSKKVLKMIALFEGLKGFTAIASAFGLLSLIHHDIRHLANELIGHFGADPTHHYPELFLQYADMIASTSTKSILLLAFLYATIRIAEGVGLWLDTSWGEWLATLSGGIYIPFEIRHLLKEMTAISLAIFVFNVTVVTFLAIQLFHRKQARNKDEMV